MEWSFVGVWVAGVQFVSSVGRTEVASNTSTLSSLLLCAPGHALEVLRSLLRRARAL